MPSSSAESGLPKKYGSARFRDKITLYKDVGDTFDSRGQIVSDTTTPYSCYADIRPLRGSEGEFARQLNGQATHSVTIRYTTFFGELDRKHWFTFDGRTFQVVQMIDIDNRRRLLEMLCGEVV